MEFKTSFISLILLVAFVVSVVVAMPHPHEISESVQINDGESSDLAQLLPLTRKARQYGLGYGGYGGLGYGGYPGYGGYGGYPGVGIGTGLSASSASASASSSAGSSGFGGFPYGK